jgi:murein L,D-transpeptidase YcbB/YkuD
MFEDGIKAVVFNPPWNVPADIAAREVWPRIRRDPGYMAREGYVVRPGGGLQQLPGPRCALGNIKFDLSNPFGVYLHDTPSRSLFARDSRTLSHGCMRLEKPNALAKRLLAGDPAWPETRIDFAIAGGKTVRAPLLAPVPLYVFYWTAFVDTDGQVEFRQDVYHWDDRLLALLAGRR